METDKRTPINGTEGSPIELDIAASWTKNYRDRHPGETISQFFGKEILEKILAQEGCLGIRFYYAQDKPLNGWQRFTVSVGNFITKVIGNIDGEKHLIITGAMSDGTDQLKVQHPNLAGADGAEIIALNTIKLDIVGEQSMPCPGAPQCPQNILTGRAGA